MHSLVLLHAHIGVVLVHGERAAAKVISGCVFVETEKARSQESNLALDQFAGETALAEPSNWLTLLMHYFVGW